MSTGSPQDDDLLARLPLPLAQLYRRALLAPTALDRHHNAFYLAEAALKLAACLRIGIALAHGLEPRSPLAQSLEQLCLPSVGHWVGFLRDTTDYLRRRPDAALLPLADDHDKLLRHEALPEVRAFADRVSGGDGEEQPPLTPEQVRDPVRQGVLGFFNLVAAYRNQVFGHGAQRRPAYYAAVAPLLLEATLAVLRLPHLFGGLTLAVARLDAEASGQDLAIAWRGLQGVASLPLSGSVLGPEPAGGRAVPGHVAFVGTGVRVPLHPLVIYCEDAAERERVGFLNRALTRRATAGGAAEEVRRCEYLDYATGDPLRAVDTRLELTRLLARLRGHDVPPSEVDRVIARSTAEPGEVDLAAPLAAGAVIGDFELEGELGRGGMGVVYRARQRSLNRRVALKVLPPALAADPVALARFRRETAALARCDHPNLVKILTTGSDGDRHYFAMELVEGTNLADLFAVLAAWAGQRGRPLPEGLLTAAVTSSSELARRRQAGHAPETLADRCDTAPGTEPVEPGPPPPVAEGPALADRLGRLFAGAADALAHLHERGILHRDVKPGNVMLTADGGRLVLMDLGVARLEDEAGGLTRTRQFLGTLRYASPEQVVSPAGVDARSDVYSLGAMFWELLALRPLYGMNEDLPRPEVLRRIQFDEPERIRAHRPEVSPELEAVVLQCLEKDPRRRYATAREVADDLGRWRRGEPVRARRLTAGYRLRRFLWRRRRAVAAVVALLLGLAAGYLALADADFRVPGGEATRRFLDRHEWSLFRPAPDEATLRRQAADLRGTCVRTLLEACPEYPGWWSARLTDRKDTPPAYDAWTQGQNITALLFCPETDAVWRRQLGRCLLEQFDPPHQQLRPFESGYGWQLFRLKSTDKPYAAGIGTAWALPAMARALADPDDLDTDVRAGLEKKLAQLQEALDHYQALDPRTRKPVGAWKLFVEQQDSTVANPYVTETVFLGLLELRRAGLPWRGDPRRTEELLRAAEDWELRQFDGRGWECSAANGNMEVNDGLTLSLFALLLRAEAEDGLALPADLLARIPRHLADCGTRPEDYPNSVGLFSVPFTYDHKAYNEETRVIRFTWYPWAVETAARWLTRCHRTGAPRDEVVRTRRVLGHLLIDLGPPLRDDAIQGATFVPAEMALGLAPLADGD